MPYSQELKIALTAARKAGEIQLESHAEIQKVELKDDKSPVTEVDKKCEAIIQEMLFEHFPDDGFFGEETGLQQSASSRTWIVDPLDGTRPYLRGIPTYSTLIALEEDGKPVVGVINLPALGETYWAAENSGAYCNGEPIHVSTRDSFAQVMGSGVGFTKKGADSKSDALLSLMSDWAYTYGFMDAYTYGCIASGKLDACLSLVDKAWDCAAAACIITEAGGSYSDIHGERTVHNGSFVVTNGHIHNLVLSYFKELTLPTPTL